jgi:hypothetical protein
MTLILSDGYSLKGESKRAHHYAILALIDAIVQISQQQP